MAGWETRRRKAAESAERLRREGYTDGLRRATQLACEACAKGEPIEHDDEDGSSWHGGDHYPVLCDAWAIHAELRGVPARTFGRPAEPGGAR